MQPGFTVTLTSGRLQIEDIKGWKRTMTEAQDNAAAERAVQYLQECVHTTVRPFCGTKQVSPPNDCWQVN